MVDDARSQFVEGLRVTAEHLQHLQDRLRESVRDLRRTVGSGRIAWGLVVRDEGGTLRVEPGVAFAPGGVRLNLDSAVALGAMEVGRRVVLRAVNGDQAALRVGNAPTVITLLTQATLEADDGSDPGPDALVIARLTTDGGGVRVEQAASLFAAAGVHTHSGEHRQDAQGRWYYDGAPLAAGVGGVGPAGPPGSEGAVGAAGPVGPAGANGATGPAGPQGDAGPAGAAGAPAQAGPEGQPGPTGPEGQPGPIGTAGSPGATGDTGAAGAVGPAGPPGEAGAAGPPGFAGPAGPAGPVGAAGAAGDAGATGAAGVAGQTGASGVPGPAGPAGTAGLADWPFIEKTNWPQGKRLTAAQALELLRQVQLSISTRFNEQTQEQQPQVVQVWFEPARLQKSNAGANLLMPEPVMSLHGSMKVSPQTIAWQIIDDVKRVNAMLGGGGRMTLRVHCGHLVDEKERALSSSVDALVGTTSPRLPAGVFEGWFFVSAATNPLTGTIGSGLVGEPVITQPVRKVAPAVKRAANR